MNSQILKDQEALKIILNCKAEMKDIKKKESLVARWMVDKKLKNIKLRANNLDPDFRAVVCSIYNHSSSISGFTLVLYKDHSGPYIIFL